VKRIGLSLLIGFALLWCFYAVAAVGGGLFMHADPDFAWLLSVPVRIPELLLRGFGFAIDRSFDPIFFVFNFFIYSVLAYCGLTLKAYADGPQDL
jgi:hypothetical protein